MLLSLHQARISSEEISIKGRMILSLTGGIAQAPLSPVPLASLNKRVSALSVKLWAVAILSQGIVLKKSYLACREYSSTPIPAFLQDMEHL